VESAELIAILREVRDRVRARHPQTSGPGNVALPDLMPLVHARDSAIAKVASIGTVNPRPGGSLNGLIQAWKRLLARVLDWHVREQVVFNRAVVECIDAAIEALNDNNRALADMGERMVQAQIAAQSEVEAARVQAEARRAEAEELKDIRLHWEEWRKGWEYKVAQNEIQFLRSVADLQSALQHRMTLMDSSYRETARAQHADFDASLRNATGEIWGMLERAKLEYERLIHSELHLLRQRTAMPAVTQPPVPAAPEPQAAAPFDYGRFAERFRGSEEYVKTGQQIYAPYFAGRKNVLDIGCGRGEFLELLQAADVGAKGVDSSAESIALCHRKGLQAELADLFSYLEAQPESSLDGIFCAQVVEHLPPQRVPELVRLAVSRLEPGGVIAIETPNPECLAIFASHFYLDPTHTRPIPYPLLVFYLEEFGIGGIEVKKLSPALDSMPSLASIPGEFREAFFGGLDYAVIGRKL
jgi:O-antigen chain-terminating methyltransferase